MLLSLCEHIQRYAHFRCEGSLCCENCRNSAVPILDSCRKNPHDIFNLNLVCTHERFISRDYYEDLLKDNLGK